MEAIIYTSNTGFTRKYAVMLGDKTGLPVYELDEADKLEKGSEVIYMGWLKAGSVVGYKKVKNRYNVKCLCCIGMAMPVKEVKDKMVNKYGNDNRAVFYLQGGYDYKKLSGINKSMMKVMTKVVVPKLLAKTERSEAEEDMLKALTMGLDAVKEENLNEIINWLNG